MSTEYGFSRKLDTPYEQTVEETTAALKEEGFGVLTEIDVKATLKEKLDAEYVHRLTKMGSGYTHQYSIAHQWAEERIRADDILFEKRQ